MSGERRKLELVVETTRRAWRAERRYSAVDGSMMVATGEMLSAGMFRAITHFGTNSS